jgi:hypothetical protein
VRRACIKIIALCAAATACAFFHPVSALAQDARASAGTVSGDCQTTAQKFVISTRTINSKANGVFSNFPESISFVQRKPGCITVAVSTEAYAPSSNSIQIRAMLDNKSPGLPTEVSLVGAGNMNHATHGMNFVFTGVAAGSHILRMQLASTGSNPVSLYTRSIILGYVK